MQATGGYVIHKSDLVRKGIYRHTTALERPVSQTDLDALNAVQATPWRINNRVLVVMTEGWNGDHRLAGLLKAEPVAVPDKMPDEAWVGMAAEDKKEHLKARAKIHRGNASAEGRQQALLDCLNVAMELSAKDTIWYPHSRCFRGRIHPLPTVGPNPQGNDISKSLIEFGEGMALGDDGFYWLMVRLANCAGQDKLPLDERVQWVVDNAERIIAAAEAPLEALWWAEVDGKGDAVMDEPWCLLATIFEVADVWMGGDDFTYVSHLPVAMDGACNGIQHLSAMGLDPVGAKATNLIPGSRQDIYTEVMKAVIAKVEVDAADGLEVAMGWHGKIDRKTVKRAVMTTPYGVTNGGIRAQLIADGLVPEGDAQGAAADYLRDCLVLALEQTVVSAKSIMAWLQVTAYNLAQAGEAYEFRTPTGSLVRQAYHAISSDRVVTLCGRLRVDTEMADGPLSPRKCALAASPNTIHAFDASHLSATVVKARGLGITSFAMIHDSYGTHAANTTRLAAVLRETFVEIYSVDRIAEIAAYVRGYAPHVELPPLPARGAFDINLVLDSPFFFS